MAMAANNPTKIVYITRAYGERAGGMERMSWEFSEALKAQSDVSLEVIAFKGRRILSPLFNLLCLPKAFFASRNASAIHIGDPMLSFAGWLLKLLLRKPIVVTVHGLDIAYSNPLYQLYLFLFFRGFDTYLPISLYTARLLQEKNIKGCIETITPGVNDRYYNPQINRQYLATGLSRNVTGKIVLFTVGRLVSRKGQAWFIANVLPQLPPQFIYVVAGTGPDQHAVEYVTKEHNMEDRVILLGRVSEETLAVLYNTVDAFIQPNVPVKGDMEGFGLVLVEAALCGRFVFASNLEGMTDAIIDGKNGTLIPAADILAWRDALVQFGQQAKNFSQEARDFTLANFTWEHYLEKYRALLAQIK